MVVLVFSVVIIGGVLCFFFGRIVLGGILEGYLFYCFISEGLGSYKLFDFMEYLCYWGGVCYIVLRGVCGICVFYVVICVGFMWE